MQNSDVKDKTKKVAYHLYRSLPRSREAQVIGNQLFRSATSVAANYHAANRARSRAEFTSKLGVVVEEADETLFWLEGIKDNAIVPTHRMEELVKEANELVAIFTVGRRSAKKPRGD
jgi:four helix bundle protein